MIDLQTVTQSFGDDAPSGEDLEYDTAFTELLVANQPIEERVIGDSVIAATDPDYDTVEAMAVELLGRTRDLRVAVILANTALRTDGLPAFEQVLRYIRSSVEDFWDSVHPQLDAEDDDDPTMRVNAVLGLTDSATVLRALKLAPVTDSRGLGRFCLRDMLVAEGEISAPDNTETPPDRQLIAAAFQDSSAEHLQEMSDAVEACLKHVTVIASEFDDRIGSEGPDLDPLAKLLQDIRRRLPTPAADDGGDAEASEPKSDANTGTHSIATTSIPDAIEAPHDVTAAIDRILDYYARKEPSSPLPLLLHRARRLVSADFVTIMKDMAPQGMENVSLIGGIDAEDAENEDHEYD
ncbi:MAG: type VI secretion system protein TssA [Paracoccaceae bacterium]